MDPSAIMTVFFFLFGLIVGSFLNVCIYRLPLDKSIIHPPSSCPECGERIRFYDNIPVISYVLLLGKCRHCRKSVSLVYPVVESITGLLSLALFVRYGLSPKYFLLFAFSASLVVISFIDLHYQIIPNVISLPGIVFGLVASFLGFSMVVWLDSLIGVIAGGGFFFLVSFFFQRIRGKEGLGGGDIKLLAMIGAWIGGGSLLFVVFISSVAGTLIGGGSLLFAGQKIGGRIPYGPFLVLGALIFLFFGTDIMSLYGPYRRLYDHYLAWCNQYPIPW